jgi:heme exporter protein D
MSYSSIAWLPLAVGLTVLGIVLSYLAYKRGGWRAGLRGVSWSLLPIAAYLTGAIEMLWKVGAAIGDFGTDFVFSPVKWVGVGVTGLALALFLASGGRLRRRAARDSRRAAARDGKKTAADSGPGRAGLTEPDVGTALTRAMPTTRTPVPATPAKPKASRKAEPADDDDMKDIEDILRKRGI